MEPSPIRDRLARRGAVFAAESGPPLHFGDAPAEAESLRTGAGVFDASDHDVLRVTGKDRVDLLQRITSNDVKRMAVGAAHRNCFTSAKGRVIDRVRLLVDAEEARVVASPGRSAAVASTIGKYTIVEDVRVEAAACGMLHLLGPTARATAGALLGADPPARDRFVRGSVAGVDALVLGTEGLLEHPGWLLITPAAGAVAILDAILSSGASPAPRLVGSLAFDAVRVENGLPLFGREVTEDDNPLEAGFWDSVSFDKGCYVGQEVIARLRTYDKVQRLMTLLAPEAAVAPGATLFADDKEAGRIAAAASPPLVREPRALGFVKRRAIQAGAALRAVDPASGPLVRVIRPIRLEA
jgi:folate-binding protein YgfZ